MDDKRALTKETTVMQRCDTLFGPFLQAKMNEMIAAQHLKDWLCASTQKGVLSLEMHCPHSWLWSLLATA